MANKTAIPIDDNGKPVQLIPPKAAEATTIDDDVSSSTEITLDTDTTLLEITAKNGGVYLRWGTGDAASDAFDAYIASGVTRHYYIPRDASTGSLYTAFNVIEDDSGAAVRIVEL